MDRKEERRTEETAAFFSPSFVHRNGRLYHDPSALPLFIRTRIPPARFVATPQLRSRPPLQRTWRNEPTNQRLYKRTNERTDGWTDGRTAFLKGHFVPLSRVFSLAGRAMSSLGAAGGGGRRVKGRRKRNEPRQGRGGRAGEREREGEKEIQRGSSTSVY